MRDFLIAVVITVLAVILGLTVHPVLFFLIAFAVLYLVMRSRGRTSHAL